MLPGSGRRRVSAALAALWVCGALTAFAADDSGARVTLLSTGPRASIVIELDDETPKATAIEATDSNSVAVEIGPVRGKVANQLLQAARSSPLVSHVRIRGVTQGAEGTIITIHIVAKVPVSGSVRRAQRRIYVDLEPRQAGGTGPAGADRLVAVDAAVPTQTAGTLTAPAKPAAPPVKPAAPAAAPVRSPAPVAATARPAAAPPIATTAPPAVAVAGPPAATFTAPVAAPTAPAPDPVLPKPAAAAGTFTPNVAPATSTPGLRPVATATTSLAEVQLKAQQLVSAPDVKALERMKTDLESRRSAAAAGATSTEDIDALLARFEQFLAQARRNQLAADGSLFKGNQPAAPGGSVGDFRQALAQVKPDLESVASALRGWSGGSLPPANLQGAVASLMPRLRALKPSSSEMVVAHARLGDALDALALMWAKAAVETPPEGTEQAVIERARDAVDDFLRLERTAGSPSSAAR